MSINRLLSLAVVSLSLVLPACASTFVASKDGKGYYVGNSSDAAYRMFCESGDLERILAATTIIEKTTRSDLYASNCGTDRSNDKVRKVYATMTAEQRRDLRQALKLPAASCRESRFSRLENYRIRSHSPLQAARNALTPEFKKNGYDINAMRC